MGIFSGKDFKPGCGDDWARAMATTVLCVSLLGFAVRAFRAARR